MDSACLSSYYSTWLTKKSWIRDDAEGQIKVLNNAIFPPGERLAMYTIRFVTAVCSIVQLVGVCAASGGTNVLPNASFELGFGEGIPTHWLDYQNRFTLKLMTKGQIPSGQPGIEPHEEAPDGHQVVRLPAAPNAPVHLPSPVVVIRPAQAYTLSVFARSDEPSARIQLTMWTRSMDFEQAPDAYSPQITLSDKWQRYPRAAPG